MMRPIVLEARYLCRKINEDMAQGWQGSLWCLDVSPVMDGDGRGSAYRRAWESYLGEHLDARATWQPWDRQHYLIWTPFELAHDAVMPTAPVTLTVEGEAMPITVRITRFRTAKGDCGERLLDRVLQSMATTSSGQVATNDGDRIEGSEEAYLRQWELAARLSGRVEDPGWFLVYQPQVSLKTHQMVGAEVLARWRTHDERVISPLTFIPWLENQGWMPAFGSWVLNTAAQQWSRWQSGSGMDALRLCVNVSAYQLRDARFPSQVLRILNAAHLDPSHVELELTEGTPWHDLGEVASRLHMLRHEGIRLMLDDFGQGVAGLNALRQLPLDGIKIDRAFITQIDIDSRRDQIVEATINLAHALGLMVTAEGVETAGEWDRLQELQCDLAQGYWISRPVDQARWLEGMREASGGIGALDRAKARETWLTRLPRPQAKGESLDVQAQRATQAD